LFLRDAPETPAVISGRNACVIWADDDAAVRETGWMYCAVTAFHVLTAADGKEALRVFLSRRGDIKAVVLDVIMPEMGGVKAARRMREVQPSLPIVLMTGYDLGGEAKAACDEGVCNHVLGKPANHGQLAAMLQSMIRK